MFLLTGLFEGSWPSTCHGAPPWARARREQPHGALGLGTQGTKPPRGPARAVRAAPRPVAVTGPGRAGPGSPFESLGGPGSSQGPAPQLGRGPWTRVPGPPSAGPVTAGQPELLRPGPARERVCRAAAGGPPPGARLTPAPAPCPPLPAECIHWDWFRMTPPLYFYSDDLIPAA